MKPVTSESTENQGDTKRVGEEWEAAWGSGEGTGDGRVCRPLQGVSSRLMSSNPQTCMWGSDIFQLLAVRGRFLFSPAWLCNEMGPNKAAPTPRGAHPS